MMTPKKRSTKKRLPFQHYKRNPFSSKNNFPGLDEAFHSSSSTKPSHNSSSSGSGSGTFNYNNNNNCIASPDRNSSIAPSSILDMSIGTRAMMTEHARYISKHGIDGMNQSNHSFQDTIDGPNHSFLSPGRTTTRRGGGHGNSATYSSSTTNTSPYISRNGDDEEWDRVMDGEANLSTISYSSTFIDSESNYYGTNHYPPSLHNHHHHHNRIMNLSTTVNENEPLHIHNTTATTTTDVNTTIGDMSDFFNSSRVAMLATPEKNKPKVDEASRLARLGISIPMKRGGGHGGHGGGTAGNGSGSGESGGHINISTFSSVSISGGSTTTGGGGTNSSDLETSGMVGLFQAAMRLNDEKEGAVGGAVVGHGNDSPTGKNDGEENDDDDEEEEVEGSFISYQEPNLSLIRSDGKSSKEEGKLSSSPHHDLFEQDEEGDNPIHGQESSFISYREPDLSIIHPNEEDDDDGNGAVHHHHHHLTSSSSNTKSLSTRPEFDVGSNVGSDILFPPSTHQQHDLPDHHHHHHHADTSPTKSDFRLDMSEIRAPSDFDQGGYSLVSPKRKEEEDTSSTSRILFSTPKKHGGDNRSGSGGDGGSRRTNGTRGFSNDIPFATIVSPNKQQHELNLTNELTSIVSSSSQGKFQLQSHLQRSLNATEPSHFLVNKDTNAAFYEASVSDVNSDTFTPHILSPSCSLLIQKSTKEGESSSSISNSVTNRPNFSGLSPISNHILRGGGGEGGAGISSSSPVVSPSGSKNGSLFCTTLTDIQPQNVSITTPPMLPKMGKRRNGSIDVSSTSSSSISMHKKFQLQPSTSSTNGSNDDMLKKHSDSVFRHRSRLGERYFNADRFEDSYIVPACSLSTTCNSSTTEYNEKEEEEENHNESERSVAKSLLQTFESADLHNLCVYNMESSSPERINL